MRLAGTTAAALLDVDLNFVFADTPAEVGAELENAAVLAAAVPVLIPAELTNSSA